MPIPNPIILILLALFALNWWRLQQGEVANKLYDKLDLEPLFIQKYKPAYKIVSEHISEMDYLERAELFHREFRYDVVKYMNRDLADDKIKVLKKKAKTNVKIPFDSLPEELQVNVNETADKLVLVLIERCKPKVIDPQKPKRRRRR